jgi:hypothetical protein
MKANAISTGRRPVTAPGHRGHELAFVLVEQVEEWRESGEPYAAEILERVARELLDWLRWPEAA